MSGTFTRYQITRVANDMRRATNLQFVGGQEDGKWYEVMDGLDVVRFAERQKQEERSYCGGASPCNKVFKAITYIRRGNVMVCDS